MVLVRAKPRLRAKRDIKILRKISFSRYIKESLARPVKKESHIIVKAKEDNKKKNESSNVGFPQDARLAGEMIGRERERGREG